jgi:hypothetical protein
MSDLQLHILQGTLSSNVMALSTDFTLPIWLVI